MDGMPAGVLEWEITMLYTLVLVVARMNIWYFMYDSAIMDACH